MENVFCFVIQLHPLFRQVQISGGFKDACTLLEGWPESSSSTSSSSTKPASNSGMEKTKLTVESSKKRRVEVTLVIDSYYTSNDPDQDSN